MSTKRGQRNEASVNPVEPPAFTGKTYVAFSSGTMNNPFFQQFTRHFNRGDYKAAEELLDQVKKINGLLTRFYDNNLRGLIATELGELDKAETLFREAEKYAEKDGHRATALHNLANLRLKQGRWEEALNFCEQGLKLSPAYEGIWVNYLIALDKLGAKSALEEVLVRLPSLFDLSKGVLRLHLLNDPDLCRVREHPVFREKVQPCLEMRRAENP